MWEMLDSKNDEVQSKLSGEGEGFLRRQLQRCVRDESNATEQRAPPSGQ